MIERTQKQAEILAHEQALKSYNITLPSYIEYNKFIHFDGTNGTLPTINKWIKNFKYSYKFSLLKIDYGYDIKGVICKLTTKEKFIINTYEFCKKAK